MPITGLKPLFFHLSLVRQGLDDLSKSDDKKLMQQYSQPILPLVSATLYLPRTVDTREILNATQWQNSVLEALIAAA